VVEGIVSSDTNQFVINGSATSCTGAILSPGSKCKIGVQLSPNATGVQSATLAINDNAANSPQVVNLRGVGQMNHNWSAFAHTSRRLNSDLLTQVANNQPT